MDVELSGAVKLTILNIPELFIRRKSVELRLIKAYMDLFLDEILLSFELILPLYVCTPRILLPILNDLADSALLFFGFG